MKKLLALIAGLMMLACATFGVDTATAKTRPAPEVDIYVDISNQTMTVDVGGWTYGRWKVSTARDGYYTPRGSWRPFMLKKMHYSKKYDNAPMPNSIFFLGGYAIHATYYINQLGRPASHGCIRLHPQNAAKLYALVQKHGLRSTRITIGN
jgi:lipoprotein-anchoring transpeptidase ErfK/SrfK